MMRLRFHVLGLPHLPVSDTFPACAFTARADKLCTMLASKGHEVIVYGVEGTTAMADAFVCTVTKQERLDWFGDYDARHVGYTDRLTWDVDSLPWQVSNARAAYWLRRNLRPRDFVCVTGGVSQQPITDGIKEALIVETCVGYLGSFAPFQVFESYAHMHQMYGRWGAATATGIDGRNFDAVIPGSYDLAKFTVREPSAPAYALFIGRLTKRKGLQTAVEACRAAGMPLKVAGQGDHDYPDVEYLGAVGAEERNLLMGGAACVLAPSEYVEPFGGVNVEAQLCGTPAITTDFGAFAETVEHGRTGFRCRTLEQWTWAVRNAHTLVPADIAARARRRYSLERIARMYDEYFKMLYTLWDGGWYQARADRDNLDWLTE